MKNYTILLLIIVLTTVINVSVNAQRILVTIAGNGYAGFNGDGWGNKSTQLFSPNDVCMDAAQNIYIADLDNNRIRKMSAARGIITTFAGGGTSLADGIPATNAALYPNYMCIDASGNIYVTTLNHKIRKIDAVTSLVSTIAGTGTRGFSGDGGPASTAMLNGPRGICIDPTGNIYFVDDSNFRVRKISSTGIITTIAGNGLPGYGGDGGPATAARMAKSYAIGVNSYGDVFFSDQIGTYIRKIKATTGIITNYAGNGGATADAHGGPATSAALGEILGIHVYGNNDLYCDDASCSNTRIDFISGNIYMESGSHSIDGYTGNGRDALSLVLNGPHGLWVDDQGNILIADTWNQRIRKSIKVTNKPSFIYGKAQTINLCHSYANFIDTLLSVTDIDSPQTQSWSVLTSPVHGTLIGIPATATGLGAHNVVIPTGASYIPVTSYSGLDSFRIRVTDGIFSDTTIVYVNLVASFTGGIGGLDNLCNGSMTTLHGCAPSGLWSASNTHATIGATTGIITTSSPGVDTVTFYVSATCPITATMAFTVNAIPSAGTITAPDSICPGATVTLTETVPGGSWYTDGTYSVIDTVSGSFTALRTGYEDVRYTVRTAWCSASAYRSVSVRAPSPLLAGVISGPDSVCMGSSITLTSSLGGGIWQTRNFNTAINPLSGIDTGVNAGPDSIAYTVTVTPGCYAYAYFIVTSLMPPYTGVIAGPDDVCAGSAITLANAVTGGVWTSANSNASIGTTGIVSGLIPGTDTIVYTVNDGFCTAHTQKAITVDPIPYAGAITGADSVCKGAAITLVNTAPGGIWSAGNANAAVSSTGVVTGSALGQDTITYAVTNICGTAQTKHNVVVWNCDYVNVITLSSAPVFNVFPDPASVLLNVEWTGLHAASFDLSLTDVTGRIILKNEIAAGNGYGKVQLNLSDINNGTYLLSLTSEGI